MKALPICDCQLARGDWLRVSTIRVSGWVKEGGRELRHFFIPFAHANGTDSIANGPDKLAIGNWQLEME